MRLRFKLPPRWKRYALFGIGVPMILLSFAMLRYYWVVFSRMIDARMSGELARDRSADLRAPVRVAPGTGPDRRARWSTG